jgi:hypothetical protein
MGHRLDNENSYKSPEEWARALHWCGYGSQKYDTKSRCAWLPTPGVSLPDQSATLTPASMISSFRHVAGVAFTGR